MVMQQNGTRFHLFSFRKFLEATYPLVHQKLEREIIAKYSYIYTMARKEQFA
jgi:hypothetical protein